MPRIGNPKHPTPIHNHQGVGTGALAAMESLADLDTVIVVLSNTLALNDCGYRMLRLILSKIVDGPLVEKVLGVGKNDENEQFEEVPASER